MNHIVMAAAALAVAPVTAHAAITVGTFDGTAATIGSTTDAFDVSQGTVVTANSGFNDATRPANAIGDTSMTGEPMSLIFQDGVTGAETLDFMTRAPVTISGYRLYLGQDGPGNGSIRGFDTVGVSGSLDRVTYTDLGSIDLTNPYQDGYGSTAITVTSTFAPATYQFFRFTGTRYDTGSYFSGGRLVELDAISDASGVPEPASWALMIAGVGTVGGVLRRRRANGGATIGVRALGRAARAEDATA